MKPSVPVVPGIPLPVTTFAKDQPEYQQLPSHVDADGVVLSRWHCSLREHLRILVTGDIYLWQATFGAQLQPVKIEVEKPSINEFIRDR